MVARGLAVLSILFVAAMPAAPNSFAAGGCRWYKKLQFTRVAIFEHQSLGCVATLKGSPHYRPAIVRTKTKKRLYACPTRVVAQFLRRYATTARRRRFNQQVARTNLRCAELNAEGSSSSGSGQSSSPPFSISGCLGQSCFGQGVQVRASWISGNVDERELDPLVAHSINTFVISGMDNNSDYSNCNQNPYCVYGLPATTLQYARYAKSKGVMFFQNLVFSHDVSGSRFTNNYVVFSDGRSGNSVSPFDAAYWRHLTDLAVAAARLSLNMPETYRIDGMFFDWEIYAENGGTYFDETWGFEDPTFASFINHGGCPAGANPPLSSGQRAARLPWLQANGCLDDYYSFLSSTIERYARIMREETRAVNPNFLLGAYPSPTADRKYLKEIYRGWSTSSQPCVVWGTEMYYVGAGNYLPAGLANHKMPGGYYDMSGIYGDHLYAYYIGGLIPRDYFALDWAYDLYSVAAGSNGYWLFAGDMFAAPWDCAPNRPYYCLTRMGPGWQIRCYHQPDNYLTNCTNADEYAQSAALYYDQMDLADSNLKQFEQNPNYSSPLQRYPVRPRLVEFPTDVEPPQQTLCTSATPNNSRYNFDAPSQQFRWQHNFVLQAQANYQVSIMVELKDLYAQEGRLLAYRLLNSSGQLVQQGFFDWPIGEVSFRAPSTGQYLLELNAGEQIYSIDSTNVPLALYGPDVNIYTSEPPEPFAFWVSSATTQFTLHFKPYVLAQGETVRLYVRNGVNTWSLVSESHTTTYQNNLVLSVAVAPAQRGKLWKFAIDRPPPPQFLGNVPISLEQGMSPYLALTDNQSFIDAGYLLHLCD